MLNRENGQRMRKLSKVKDVGHSDKKIDKCFRDNGNRHGKSREFSLHSQLKAQLFK